MKKAFAILFSFALSISALAENIKDIRIVNQAGESYDNSSVAAFTSFAVGEQVPGREVILDSIAVDVSRMRESGRFSYVDARMDVEEDGVVLVYTVVAKNKLRRIVIEGADNMRNRKVRQKSELEIGQFADNATFAQAAERIKQSYRDFWYPDTDVDWSQSVNEELGVVDVVFKIKEGRKLGIKHIDFVGNNSVEAKTLRKLMQQKKRGVFSFITGSGKFRDEFADLDLFSIKSFYMNEGFLDVQVFDPVLNDSHPKRARLTFTIEEGQQYVVGDVSLEGMETFTEAELSRGILLRQGDIAAYAAINQGSENIRAFYGNRGYIRTNVRPVLDADARTGTVDIRYEISEGNVGYIKRVNIAGNERTKDEVIRRELVIYPGDIYNRGRVQTSENRLRNLNYFDYVSATPQPTGEGDNYDLNVQVKEKQTGQITAGVGFSSVDALVGYVELSQGNFDYKSWPPMGAGQKFKVRAQLGTQRNDVDVSFVEPWFLDRKLSLGLDLYHREARFFSDAYDQKNDGARISLGKPLARFVRGTLSYTLEQYNVFDVQASASDAIRNERGRRLKSGAELSLSRDTRNRYFNPTRGNKTTLTPYASGGALGAETDLLGVKLRTTQYWPLIGDMVFKMRGEMESVEAFGDSKASAANDALSIGDGVPIFDRLFLGGSYTLRGYEFRDVGPKATDRDDPVGGNSSASLSVELTFPLWDQIRGATFYDWGFVNVDSWDFDPSLYHDNWGIGLRFDLPGFPLHLDYAWPITHDESHSGNGRFNFLIGHTF